jgi:hypothetical protein
MRMKINHLQAENALKNQRWNLSGFLTLILIFTTVLMLGATNVFAQQSYTKPNEISNERPAVTATAADFSNEMKAFTELEVKVNSLLKEARILLAEESNKQWFQENLEKGLRQKSEQVCPNLPVLTLMFGNDPFVCTPNMDKQELFYAIEFLNVSINGMLTK